MFELVLNPNKIQKALKTLRKMAENIEKQNNTLTSLNYQDNKNSIIIRATSNNQQTQNQLSGSIKGAIMKSIK